jgi:hypothetical protein
MKSFGNYLDICEKESVIIRSQDKLKKYEVNLSTFKTKVIKEPPKGIFTINLNMK